MNCPRCQADNPVTARFCQQCGGPLPQALPLERCPKCQAALPPGARFCVHCGEPLAQRTPIDDTHRARPPDTAPAPTLGQAHPAGGLAGERRVVTALHVHIVDPGLPDEPVSASDWAAVVKGAMDRCSPPIHRYGGTIASLMEDEVLAFFGAPVAHEDDPVRAVHAALELVAALRAYAVQVHNTALAVRVILSTGPVVVSQADRDLRYEYSSLSDAIQVAIPAESCTWPMGVLITENTHHSVAPFFDCTDLGPVGAGRMHVYHVHGHLQSEERSSPRLQGPMVGRKAEMDTLLQLSHAVGAGLGRAALIVGEPGLGKTRLVAEWRAASATAPGGPPLHWAKGRCLSHSRDLPYRLLLSLIRSLIGVPAGVDEPETRAALQTLIEDLFGSGAPFASLPEAHQATGGRLTGEAGRDVYAFLCHLLSLKLEGPASERVQQLDPQALRAQYLAAMRQLLRALAARSPLVLILENLHWADPSSTELLASLLPLAATTRILFCLITRPDRDAPGWRLVTAARDVLGKSLAELTLSPLPTSETGRLISGLLEPEALSEPVRTLILGKAEGNPLFVEEVIRMLVDRGAIHQVDGRWTAGAEVSAVDIPDSLQRLLLARIDPLPNTTRIVLRVASVIGRQFSVQVLEQVLDEGERGGLIHHLSELESAGLIRVAQIAPRVAYRFRSVLIQDAAYYSVLDADRRRLHLAVGKALERIHHGQQDSGALAPVLAHHFCQARDRPRALQYLSQSGQAALASYANQEAEGHFQRALGLAHLDAERAPLLSGLGEALYWQNRFQDAALVWQKGVDLYRALGSSNGISRLYARSARAAWSAGDTPESLRLCQAGLSAVGDAPDSAGLALLLHEAARAYLFNGQQDKARLLCRRALEMARRLDIVDVQADALATMGLFSDPQPEKALEALHEAVRVSESAGLLNQAARAHVNLAAKYATTMADLRAGVEHYERAAALRRQQGDTAGELLSLGGMTDLAMKLGALKKAEETFPLMQQLCDALVHPGPAALVLRINEAMLLRYKGELDQAAQRLRSLQAEARRRSDLHNLIEINTQLADALLEARVLAGGTRTGRLSQTCSSEAKAALSETLQICARWSLSGLQPRCLMSEVHACERQFADADRLLAETRKAVSARPDDWEGVWLSVAEGRVAVAEGRLQAALSAFEQAAETFARLGMRWWWARTLQEWAEAHIAHGEPAALERARALYRESLTTFQQLGVPRYPALMEERLQAVNAAVQAEMLAHDKVAQELAAASHVQGGFLPAAPPRIPGWQLAASLTPARETSGDFYDLIPLPDARWGLVVADVADKGMGAALYMALSRTLIRTYAGEYPERPELALKVANRRILEDMQVNMFVSVFYGVLDPLTGTLEYCNAGHTPPYLIRATAQAGTAGGTEALRRTGLPLGIIEGASWEHKTAHLAPGDVLVLYTDGITEAHNAQKELFGPERTLETALAHRDRPAGDIQDALLSAVRRFAGDTPQFDDITLMVVVRDSPGQDGMHTAAETVQ